MRPPREPKDLITGELYELRQPVKTLKVLDGYEEHYHRELRLATLETDERFRAWVYVYRQPRPEYCRVYSGEW